MSGAALDRLLALLVLALAATGLLSLRAGTAATAWVFVLHGFLAGILAAAVAVKLRRSLPGATRAAARDPSRRLPRLALGLAVSLLAIAALSGGYLWVASGELLTIGTWTVLTLHAWVGLILVPLVALHLVPRRWRLLRPGDRPLRATLPISRRTVLAGGLLLATAGAAQVAALTIERLRGGARRFTGSRLLASGGVPPVTTFFGEPVPAIERATWRVEVGGAVARSRSWTIAELEALEATELTAILDCTSGWAIETGWRGIPLAALIDAAAPVATARTVVVRSISGWSSRLPIGEARACLLATAVAGLPLPDGNGAPLRLVVPDRRGLDWVKWVASIEIA
jgi:hypothetical protein